MRNYREWNIKTEYNTIGDNRGKGLSYFRVLCFDQVVRLHGQIALDVWVVYDSHIGDDITAVDSRSTYSDLNIQVSARGNSSTHMVEA